MNDLMYEIEPNATLTGCGVGAIILIILTFGFGVIYLMDFLK